MIDERTWKPNVYLKSLTSTLWIQPYMT